MVEKKTSNMKSSALSTVSSNDQTSKHWSEQSFIGIVHEEYRLDADAFLLFESAVGELRKHRDTDQDLRRLADRVVSHIFGYTMLMFSCHYDPKDGFTFQGLTEDELFLWRERVQLVCEGYFGNPMPSSEVLPPRPEGFSC